jgi:hypothetical protein
MNTMTTSKWCKGMIIAAALVSTPLAVADPSPGAAGMKTALAKAAQGPQQLRWYVWRTQAIYALNFNDVMELYETSKTASAQSAAQVAQAGKQ